MSGRRAIGIEKFRAELIRRGAPEEIVEECLGEIPTANQREVLQRLLEGKFAPTDSRAKAGRFLIGRGFSDEDVETALEDFFPND